MAKILIIETSIELREALVDLLELEGHTVFWALNDEAAAWEKVMAVSPDLILQDISVTDESRFNLLLRMRQRAATTRTPVIYLIHYFTQGEVARCKELGASACLLKPFDTVELINLIDRCTRRPRDYVTLSMARDFGNYR